MSNADEREALLARAVADAASASAETRARAEDACVANTMADANGDATVRARREGGWGRLARPGMIVRGALAVVCALGVVTMMRARGGALGARGGAGRARGRAGADGGHREREHRSARGHGDVETWRGDASEGDVSAGDPLLGGYSKQDVADAIKHVVMEETKTRRRADAVGSLGLEEGSQESWNTPTLLMARPGSSKERDALKVTLSKLLTTYDVNLVAKNVKVTAAVDPNTWPEGLDRSVYALKTVFEKRGGDYLHPDFSLLHGLDWIDAPMSRDLDGKIAGAWAALSHHVGELFGHMYQWQLAKDACNNATLIVDSDGLSPARLSVPVSSFGAIVDHAPKDFDVILLNTYPSAAASSKVVAEFPDHRGHDMKITTWNKPGMTGLSTYIISNKFPDKVFEYAASKGAGYLDSWIVDDLCTHPVCDDDGEIVGKGSLTATTPLLKCYHARGVIETFDGAAKENQNEDKEEVVISSKAERDESIVRNETSSKSSKEKVSKETEKRSHGVEADDEGSKDSHEHKKTSKHKDDAPEAKLTSAAPWASPVSSSSVSGLASAEAPTKLDKNALKDVQDFFQKGGKAEASLGAKPGAERGTSVAHDLISHSIEELNGARASLVQRRHAIAQTNKQNREHVEAMLRRWNEIKASGREATARDLQSAVTSTKMEQRSATAPQGVRRLAPAVEAIVHEKPTRVGDEKSMAASGVVSMSADAEVDSFLTDLLK